jgi:aerotaxis receptor
MIKNLPVTQNEYELPDGALLVSTTDLKGNITHCNYGFVVASGYDYGELLGQPHDMVRHRDMPPEAFKDLWSTIGRGRPWTGIVKNRRKNGDHYWVQANVTPVMEGGKPKAYMSVRLKPTREQIRDAQALYAKIAAQRNSGKFTFKLHAGNVRALGWRDGLGKLHRLTLFQRAAIGLGLVTLALFSPYLFLQQQLDPTLLWVQLVAGLLGSSAFLFWFARTVSLPLDVADQLAGEVAGCNLDGDIAYDTTSPIGSMMRRLWLINLNMRAIVADVRAEVSGVTQASQDILHGSRELSSRTDVQAQGVETTTASVEEISGTVAETAGTAQSLGELSTDASTVAADGMKSINEVSISMHRIESSSTRINEIIGVIEQLAFQTNLLALNAAVEAAHAGDQGRGFAVVASEVRQLAQRSNDAAHQIRDLIQESSQMVSAGTTTVDAAAKTIRTAVDKVNQVTERLGEISLATREGSIGVAQISEAMHLLDDVTRQNADLVQQSATACAALNARADTLQRAVQIFSVTAITA